MASTKLNLIQQKIKELDGGTFQKLFDSYLFRKYKLKNIHTLGSYDGANKSTKGIPDSYVINDDKTYTLIMYGTAQNNPYKKLKSDILSCLNEKKLSIETNKIKQIICGYCSSNLTLKQVELLRQISAKKELVLIDLGTISYDLCYNYQHLAFDFLGVPTDTRQIYSPEDFIKAYDKNPIGSPLNIKKFMFRKNNLQETIQSILNNKATLIFGASGAGKTRLVLEVLKTDIFSKHTILCVKNNGEILSSDINSYISTPGKYILFLDDANQTTSFEYIINFVNNPPKNIEVKLIMTVRDYAKTKIWDTLIRQIQTNIIKIEKFNNYEIKEILKNNLGIINDTYLERITEISKGNIRIAMLAGRISIKGKLGSIKNVIDVFKNYYSEILLKQEISRVESYTLFIISFFKAIHIYENKFLPTLLDLFNINKNDFIQACIDLYQKELIDLYDNKLAKISDQSLKDYILYYILIERRFISIKELLELMFPAIKDAIINIIKTILNLFYTDETSNYIRNQIIEAWHGATENNKKEYLKSFSPLNQDEALLIIKKEVDTIPKEQFNLSNTDFEEYSKNRYFKMYLPEILSGFKYNNNYLNALELLLEFAGKNLDCAMEACCVFCANFSYDKNSSLYNFEKEFLLIKTIFQYYNKNKDPNTVVILLEVLKQLLKGEIIKTEPGEDIRSIVFVTIHIPLSDDIKNLRSFIWHILSELYKNPKHQKRIEEFIYKYNNEISDSEARAEFIKYDMECFEKEFGPHFKKISFSQAIILENLESKYYWLKIKPPCFLSRYHENKEFSLIKLFIEDEFKNKNYIEAKKIKTQKIEKLITEYNIDNFKNLFRICKKYEKLNFQNSHQVGGGLYVIFKKLEERPELYTKIVKVYLQEFPYFLQTSKIIVLNLIKFAGKNKTIDVINSTADDLNSFLLYNFYELLPKDLIDDSVCNELENFIKNEILRKHPRIVDIYALENYKAKNLSIVDKITNIIINCDKRIVLIRDYLNHNIRIDDIQKLIKIFDNNTDVLEKIYFLQLENFADFHHLLFSELMKNSPDFWNKFIVKLTDLKEIPPQLDNLFKKIWQKNDYKKYIDILSTNILTKDSFKIHKYADIISAIFRNSENTENIIKNNKKQWIKNFIVENIKDIGKLKIIFKIIVDCFRNDKIKYFELLLKNNIDFETFKQIPLFTWNIAWSGSQIPLIDEQIKFLYDLNKLFQKADFIEHKAYINKMIECQNRKKEEAKQREYIENYY